MRTMHSPGGQKCVSENTRARVKNQSSHARGAFSPQKPPTLPGTLHYARPGKMQRHKNVAIITGYGSINQTQSLKNMEG